MQHVMRYHALYPKPCLWTKRNTKKQETSNKERKSNRACDYFPMHDHLPRLLGPPERSPREAGEGSERPHGAPEKINRFRFFRQMKKTIFCTLSGARPRPLRPPAGTFRGPTEASLDEEY